MSGTGLGLCGLCAVVALVACAPKVPPADTPAEQRRVDLDVLAREFVARECGMTAQTRALFEARVATLREHVEALTPAGFVLGVQRAVGAVDNAHSEVTLGEAFARRLPLELRWFEDGLFIVGAPGAEAALLGARVEALGSATPEALLAELDVALGGKRAHARVLAERLLTMPGLLQALGAVEDSATVTIAVVLPDKLPATRTLKIVPRDAAEAGRVRLLDSVALLPLYLRAPEQSATLAWLAHADAAYIRINRNDDEALPDRLSAVLEDVAARRPRHAIVDLRLNAGGDYGLTADFARALPTLIPRDGRIVLIVGPRTFSAGIVTAAILRRGAGARALIAGEPVGDRLRFWSEGGAFRLPYSGLRVNTADGYHDWAGGTDLSDPRYRCNERQAAMNRAYSAAAGSLEPEILAPLTSADYAVGRDPVLPAVLKALSAGS